MGAAERRDGGWGWLVVASTFAVLFIRASTIKVFAVLLPSIKDDMQLDTWVVGWLISTMLTISDFTALPAAWLCSRSGHRLVVMTGGLMFAIGLVSSALALATPHLFVSVILTGIGMGMIENPPLAMIGSYFQSRYATANSLALSAFPIAIMVAPPVTQVAFDAYGWRGTLLLWGAFSLHLVACGGVLRPVPAGPTGTGPGPEPSDREAGSAAGSGTGDAETDRRGLWRRLVRATHLYLLQDFGFLTVLCVLCFEKLSFMTWMIYVVPHGLRAGLGPLQAASLPSGTGLANLLGKVVQGVFVDSRLVHPITLLILTAVVAGVCLMLGPLPGTFAGMYLLGFVYGLAVGTLYPLAVAVLRDLVGEDRFIIALGWCTVVLGIFRMPMGIFPGWLYDVSGSYDTSFVALGLIELFPVPLLAIDRLRRSRWCRGSLGARRDDYEHLIGRSGGSLSRDDD